MALRDILVIPDKRLRLVSRPVEKVDAAVRKLAEDMFETMYEAPGIGLAAIQIGEPLRLVTMDLAKKEDEKAPQVFINPEITWSSDEMYTHDLPSSARSSTSCWISALVPTSMPRVGSSMISTLGLVDSHLASTTFCWLPPER